MHGTMLASLCEVIQFPNPKRFGILFDKPDMLVIIQARRQVARSAHYIKFAFLRLTQLWQSAVRL
jgi:hypothetical protein